ncbi:MAG TPA: SHOCT domain-containing protein [Acidimicrobiales bacterium]
MVLADTSLGDLIWLTFIVFFWVMFISLYITLMIDLFRDKDASGVSKVIWLLVLIFLPFVGSLIYVLVRGNGMAERNMKQAQAERAQFDEYVRQAAGSTGAADQIAKAAQLRDSGAISNEEYEALKAKALS